MAILDLEPKLYTLPDPKQECVFRVEHVSKRFGDKVALDDVSFWIPKGEFLCLAGPNGAGKSTFLKIALGLLSPDRGTIDVHGRPPGPNPQVGYVPQRKTFSRGFPARVEELIVANIRGRWPLRITHDEHDRVIGVLDRVGGKKLIHKELAGLSGGEMQRAFLARALVTDPELLILDEPTAGVDVQGRAEFLEILAEISASDEIAAILVTHNLAAIAKTAERVLYLEHRVVAWGLPNELLGRESLHALSYDTAAPPPDSE
jgi:ABC-type Mn2+/Zn2+ transport system ATPase subunit